MRIPGGKDIVVGSTSAQLYDGLERALIDLQYALADARSCESAPASELDAFLRSQEALQGAGERVRDVLLALRSTGLRSLAERSKRWDAEGAFTP